jgi:phenylpropionate dioxygenase-like ring-hydroxylating dioxygenase large terminal subunit
MDLQIDPRTFKAWLIGAQSGEVKQGKMLSRKLMSQSLIFFRDDEGNAVALEGRCPHKGVSLADGKIRLGQVQCPYHGWRFDTAGKCTHVPSTAPGEELPCATLKKYPVIEQDGWVWVFWGDAAEAAKTEPPRYPMHENYRWFEFVREIKSPPHFILENSFDPVHANFVHSGILRDDPIQDVEAKITETPRGVLVSHKETRGKKSVFASYMPFINNEFRHTEELVLPFTAFVNAYYESLHHQTILTCVPVDEDTTRVFTRTGLHMGAFTYPAYLFFRAVTPFVIPQDAKILENQAKAFKEYGGKYGFARQSDVPAFWAMRAYRAFLEGKFHVNGEPRTGEAVYRL